MAGVRLRIPLRDQCIHRKARFYSRAVAEEQMRLLANWEKSNRPTAGPLNVYFCKACGCWHVGHSRNVNLERHQEAAGPLHFEKLQSTN